jgi:hypothetical protein
MSEQAGPVNICPDQRRGVKSSGGWMVSYDHSVAVHIESSFMWAVGWGLHCGSMLLARMFPEKNR